MKLSKIVLSIFLAVLIFSLGVIPSFAVSTADEVSPEEKLSDEVLAFVNSDADEDEKIPVWVWYKDIDQDKVDELTEKETGLTPEKCQVIDEFPSAELLSMLQEGSASAESEMKAYLSDTEAVRVQERELVNIYSRAHMKIANEMYTEKSRSLMSTTVLDEENVIFASEFAPMVIAELSVDEIEKLSKNGTVEEINLYEELEFEEPTASVDDGVYVKAGMGLTHVYDKLGLTGNGVRIGLIETNVPGLERSESFTYETFEFYPSSEVITLTSNGDTALETLLAETDLTNIKIIRVLRQGELSYADPDYATTNNKHHHPNNTYKVLNGFNTGIAKNSKVFATATAGNVCQNVENLLKCGIDILEVNVGYLIYERSYDDLYDENSSSTINSQYAYINHEKYYDHLASCHSLTTVVAGGNSGSHEDDFFGQYTQDDGTIGYKWQVGARMWGPAMAYNVISVGGCGVTSSTDEYRLYNYSWKNSYEGMYGCEKPDVVNPCNYGYVAGTSNASPALTAEIALMLELKPSLSLFPQAVKAIVLASCHKKATQTDDEGGQETMSQGLTERQGAGIPDAWTMASIICQGSYGVGILSGANTEINIEQPPYGAENMNVSISWIKENTATNSHYYTFDVTDVPIRYLSLRVKQNNSTVKSSSLVYSSTQMCYVPLSSTDFKYQFQIINNTPSVSVRYGYAWSTDTMRASPEPSSGFSVQDGIYFLKNKYTDRYLTYNTSATDENLKVIGNLVSNQNNLTDNRKWIVKSTSSGYNLGTGYGTTKLYLRQSSTYYSGANLYSKLSSSPLTMKIEENSDGTFSICDSSKVRILTCEGGYVIWSTCASSSEISDNQKWYFSKSNYIVGDANTDGTINSADVLYIQRIAAGLVTPTNIERYLSDVNRNGSISTLDATKVYNLINSIYVYE